MADLHSSNRSSRASTETFTDRLKRDGRERLESGKSATAEHIGSLAGALDAAASRLQDKQPTMAEYASRMAHGIDGLAQRVRDGSLEDLTAQTRQFAARNPALFLTGGFLIGVALARLLKVTAATADDVDVPRSEPIVNSDAVTSASSDFDRRDWTATRGGP